MLGSVLGPRNSEVNRNEWQRGHGIYNKQTNKKTLENVIKNSKTRVSDGI